MKFSFDSLRFEITEGRICLLSAFGSVPVEDGQLKCFYPCVEVQIAGRNHDAACGAKQFMSSEWSSLRYVSHHAEDGLLEIVQENELISVVSRYERKRGGVIVSSSEVRNISSRSIVLEQVSSFCMLGLCRNTEEELKTTYLYRFHNSWYEECQPRRESLFGRGLSPACFRSMNRVAGCNVGSWSTKEELPQAILEFHDRCLMFQIESNNSWYWELGENVNAVYLIAGGGNATHTQWSKPLEPGESYSTVKTALVQGKDANEVIARMTWYRRSIVRRSSADADLPVIFNEYMHLSWDSPEEERTKRLVPIVASLGVDYYVIDCGWHDEVDGKYIYPYVGCWRESKRRFPHGIAATIDFIHAHGMKAGLWLEPEIIGYLCEEMSTYYPEEAFLRRNGERITVMGRQFLDFRNQKVRAYLDGVVDMLVSYGVDYLKMDYNEDCGPGTEVDAYSLGEGLEKHAEAFLGWLRTICTRYPKLIVEACASGGQRLDYKTLGEVSLASTSDQTKFFLYPYIASNIQAAVLPEQAAVWSYPVDSQGLPGEEFFPTEEWVDAHVSDETIIMNMVNSLLGRMHLASHLELLNERGRELVKEGILCCRKLSDAKKKGVPCFPIGFADFSRDFVASGLRFKDKLYLAVWNLRGGGIRKIGLKEYSPVRAEVFYPASGATEFNLENGVLSIGCFERQARLFEIECLERLEDFDAETGDK